MSTTKGKVPATAYWPGTGISRDMVRDAFFKHGRQTAFEYHSTRAYHPRVGDDWPEGRTGLGAQKLDELGYPTRGRLQREAARRKRGGQ